MTDARQICEMCGSNDIDSIEGWCYSCGHNAQSRDCQCDECQRMLRLYRQLRDKWERRLGAIK